jgi:HK97 family phage major capsid protein
MREGFALDTATGAAGGYLVPTVLMIENLIELLRAQIMLSMLGARTLTDLVGDVAIPSKATGVATFWVAESGNVTEDTALTFGQVLLEPKTVGTAVKFSRRLMVQAAADVEALLEEEIAEAIATEIDLQGIQGDGTGNKPTGIISTVGVGAQAFAALGNPTWVETLGLWSDVAAANALRGTLAWLAPPPVAANMMARDKATNAGRFVWENGRVMEFPAYATSQMPANKLLFGNYRDVLIGLWGALDLNLDTVTYGLAGGRRLIAHQDVDVKLRHAASFSVGSGGT